MHTENSNLCQVITTFTTGLTALNGLTAQVQNFATGTSGTDFNISSSSTTHTFNLPDASASNRGVVTTGTQTFAGYKIFNGTIGANVDIQLATQGTALNTFLKNINAAGQTSIGSNGFGFNNSNNIYFSGSSKGGGIFAFNNTGNQTYTLQDASGTLAFTSQIPSNIVTDGGVGTADRVPKFTGPGVLTNSAIADQTNEVNILKRVSVSVSSHQIVLTPSLGGTSNRIETTNLPLELVTTGSEIRLAAGGATPQLTLSSAGLVTLTGALNGTSAVFSGSSEVLKINGAGTSTIYETFNNNGGNYYVGISSSTGTGLVSGASAYAMAIVTESARDLILATNNTTRLTLASTGAATFSSSVTAGAFISSVSTNGFNLDLSKSAGFGALIQLKNTSSSSNELVRVLDSSNNIISQIFPASNGIAITTGNVGIGTASPSTSVKFNVFDSSANGDIALFSTDATKADIWLKDVNTSAGSVRLRSESNALVLNAGGNERMRITSGGQVLIGGSYNPYQATNRGNITLNGSASNIITFTNNSSPRGYFYHDDTDLEILNTTGMLRFYTANTERMRITSGGYLKASNTGTYLGTTSTFHELRSNTSNSYSLVVQHSASSLPYGLGIFYTANSPNSTSNEFIYCEDTTQSKFIVWSNGSVINRTGSYGTISDIKFKENVIDATPKLDDILKLKVRNFNLIGEEQKQIGFIAQEFEEVFPSMVDVSIDKETEEEYKSIKTSVLVPMLVKAIQELKTEIDSLKNQIK
jgi:hypothetical protein